MTKIIHIGNTPTIELNHEALMEMRYNQISASMRKMTELMPDMETLLADYAPELKALVILPANPPSTKPPNP